ncbi:MAG: BMP family ABC transporter substrate-binding protein [Geminicoccaceae bacterium]|nr:BMP family ABC transporter substrate-binding protein [Geminicoccaceae bacterium]MCB9942001.1 BMP family ABC transporter substrate-binding protein [Geminicoccaceae bacterium]
MLISRRLLLQSAAMAGLASAPVLAQEPLKIGFVYVGPIGDHGWSYQHEQGRLAVQDHFGDKVKTTYVENVSEGPDAERVIRQLASSGHDLVFTTSFGFMNATDKVARQFPKVTFEHATGYKQRANLATYLTTTYQGRYVSGFLGGKLSKTGKIGYIASFPIPEVVRDINAVQLGLQRARDDGEIVIIWVNSWYDPAKEGDAARVMMNQGVDFIIQHTDSPAAMQVANEKGIWAVGQASDMSKFGPKAQVTAVIDDWAPYYIRRTQEVMDGTWKTGDHWGGLQDGMLKLSPINPAVPQEIADEAMKIAGSIADGSFHPFTGPIRNQAGEVKVAEGTEMTHEELAGMNWYVEGVKGELPQ